MIKTFCDKCGKEFDGNQNIHNREYSIQYKVWFWPAMPDDTMESEPNFLVCNKCLEDIINDAGS